MVFHGAMADEEVAGDFLAGLVLGDRQHDAPFGGSEGGHGRGLRDQGGGAAAAVQQVGGDRRADEDLPAGGRADTACDLCDCAVLDNVAMHVEIHGLVEEVFV